METLPDDRATVHPDVRDEVDALRLLVEETDGSVIAFALYRSVSEREAAVRRLNERLAAPVVECTLSAERPDPVPLLPPAGAERACVQVYDVEAALPAVTGHLNLQREAFAEVPHAVVFWVGAHGLRQIARNAPDFWAWRSGVFDVRTEQAGAVQAMTQQALTEDIRYESRGDLERRASLYRGLLREHGEQEDPDAAFVARLRLKLAHVLLLLRRFDEAEKHAREVLDEKGLDERFAATTYHQLGWVAEEQRALEEAKSWYEQSLEIKERQGDEHGAAATYHQLGIVAEEQRAFEEAKSWYEQSLEVFERQGNERGAAATYHQLGRVAEEQRALEEAKSWYERSLEIEERQGNEHGAATTYHQLGRVAQEQRALEEAKSWYERSLEIEERQGNEHGAAITYHQLGIVAQEQERYLEAGEQFIRAFRSFSVNNDPHRAQIAAQSFAHVCNQAPPDVKAQLDAMRRDAGVPPGALEEAEA